MLVLVLHIFRLGFIRSVLLLLAFQSYYLFLTGRVIMLDGINALLQCFKSMWTAIFNAPLYDSLTWGYFLIAVLVIDIFISFFIARMK